MRSKKLLSAPYLVWMGIFIIVPLGVMAFYAFTDSSGGFTFANIKALGDYLPTLADSLWIAALSTFICLLIAFPAAYFIANTSARNQRVLILLTMLPMCMSFLLRTMSLVAILEDTGYINQILSVLGLGKLSLIRNTGAVVFGIVYNYLPYMIMPLYSVLTKLDASLLEASYDLGCSPAKTFFKVTLPLSVPGIISGVTMVFVPAVSTFYISNKLGGTHVKMIGDIIETQFKSSYNPNVGAAMSMGLMVLVFICMWIMNKFTDSEEVSLI